MSVGTVGMGVGEQDTKGVPQQRLPTQSPGVGQAVEGHSRVVPEWLMGRWGRTDAVGTGRNVTPQGEGGGTPFL